MCAAVFDDFEVFSLEPLGLTRAHMICVSVHKLSRSLFWHDSCNGFQFSGSAPLLLGRALGSVLGVVH